MKMAVSEFKAKCTRVLRNMAAKSDPVEITSHGKVVAIVCPPKPVKTPDPKEFFGSLKGTVLFISEDFDEPLGDEKWEAGQ